MIASGLKKLAKENGMTVYGGVAYGSLRGFAATLSEGAGYKKVDFAAAFPSAEDRAALTEQIRVSNAGSTYRIQNISFGEKTVQVTFRDTVGTMKRIRAFLDFFLPLLEEYGAARADLCAECGGQLTAPVWVQVNGICYPMHESCARQVQLAVEGEKPPRPQGNYITGTLGALAGALLGALLWAATLNLDSSVFRYTVAMLIGWLAEKGYTLAKGRKGRGKTWIVALFIGLGVVLGAFGPEAVRIGILILNGTLEGFTLGELPLFILARVVDDFKFLITSVLNMVMGAVCAAVGLYIVLQQNSLTDSGRSFCYMK